MPRSFFLTLALSAAAAPAMAANLYVAPTGSDGTTCTLAAPCRQIRRALQLVNVGDVVLVADGSYLGFDVDDLHGAPGSPITIRAQGTGAVVTVTTDRPDDRDTIFVTFSSFIVIDGLRSFGANRAAVRVDQSPNVTVKNGVFGSNTTWGIFTDFADDLLLENNECYGSMEEHGIYVSNSGDRPVVRGNRVHDNIASGIQLNADLSAGGDGIITGALIENNILYGNGVIGGAAINLDGVQDSTVRNNVLYDNHATGIVNYAGDGAAGPRLMRIFHNTIDQASDGRWALLINNTTGPNTVRNNVLFNRHSFRGGITYGSPADAANTDSNYNVLDRVSQDDGDTVLTLAQWQAQGHELNSFAATLAALFVNANGGDYHLTLTSPAKDTGQTLASVTVDIEGNPRPRGPASDIGAYEAPVPMPALSIDDVSVAEGNSGTTSVTFTLSLSFASSQTVTVDYAAAAGTATAGVDFGGVAGTVTFPPGMTTRPVVVPVFGDNIDEVNETYFVNLSAPVGANIADGQGLGTITDDDAAGLSISDEVVRERVTPNTATASFEVTLSPANPGPGSVTVDWDTGDGTATAPADYLANSGTLTFASGASSQTVVVTVNADALVEGMETFVVTLSGSSGPAIVDGTGTAQVLDPPGGSDFSGDGRTDILWRHAVSGQNVLWYMNGATLLSGTLTNPAALPDTNWQMVGTSDFNSDGKPDILWRHAVSGENVAWFMNGANLVSGTFLTPPALADVGWKMVGTGDFNVDGKADILWRHAVSGEVVVWHMNGVVLQSGTFLTPPAFADVNWQMVGTGDFNGDGRTDILWRHGTAGQNVVWFLNGTSLITGTFTNPSTLADVNWKIVGPR